MNVMEAIQKRESIREYLPDPVESEKIQKILEAGRLAPSARNQQTWKFIVVDDPKIRERLFIACDRQPFMAQAPAALVICTDDKEIMRCGQPKGTVDCSIAMSFMLLEATELGLGTCWLGRFYEDQVREVLDIPADYSVVAITPLGYPASGGRGTSRKELKDIAFSNCFNKSIKRNE